MTKTFALTKLKTIALALIALTVAASGGCKKDYENTAVALFITGTPEVQRAGEQARVPVVMLDRLNQGDTIITAPGSELTLQLGESTLMHILGGTTVRLDKIMDDGNSSMNLDSGIILNKVDKLLKDRVYEIRTRSTLAAVRGTEFMVSADASHTVTAVFGGTVNVTMLATKEEKPVGAGFKATVEKEMTIEPLNELDRLYQEKLGIRHTVDTSSAGASDAIKAIEKDLVQKDAEISKKMADLGPRPLEEIRAQYDRIDVITLYSGKIIKGAIISRGEQLSVVTPDGLISVPEKSVKNVKIIK